MTAWEPMSSSLTWFSYRDTSPAPGGSFSWGFRTGLHRESGMPKPVDGVQPLRALCALSPRAGMTVRARGGG